MTTELERIVLRVAIEAGATYNCLLLGHVWVSTGGRNCGCEDGCCSVPVHECEVCGDCDYGDNEEASIIIAKCDEKSS